MTEYEYVTYAPLRKNNNIEFKKNIFYNKHTYYCQKNYLNCQWIYRALQPFFAPRRLDSNGYKDKKKTVY